MLEQLQKLQNELAAANLITGPDKIPAVAAATTELNNYRQNIEIMRALQARYGYGPYQPDAASP